MTLSNLLHMQTDSMRACANTIFTRVDAIQQDARQLLYVSRSVEWYGPNREVFQTEIEGLLQKLVSVAESGQVLAIRVQQATANWQEIDERHSQEFAVLTVASNPVRDGK